MGVDRDGQDKRRQASPAREMAQRAEQGGAPSGADVPARLIGEDVIYPGHPLVVGLAIMRAFPSFPSAAEPHPGGGPLRYSAAQVSRAVPGGGGSVAAALEVLEWVAGGHLRPEDAPERCRDIWNGIGGDRKTVEAGQSQAERFSEEYVRTLAGWQSPPQALAG